MTATQLYLEAVNKAGMYLQYIDTYKHNEDAHHMLDFYRKKYEIERQKIDQVKAILEG